MPTLAQFQARHSVRHFSDRPLEAETAKKLSALLTDINTHEPGMHFQLITDDPAPFAGFGRSYGMFSGVRNYLAAVVDTSFANWRERAGFYGMQVVMRAQELGLGSCFVSGTYSAGHVSARIKVGEEMPYILPLGYARAGAKESLTERLVHALIKRRPVPAQSYLESPMEYEQIIKILPGIADALEALSCVPSALNKRPARLVVMPLTDTPRTAADLRIECRVPAGNTAQEIDLGIALYCITAFLPGYWDWGNPALLHPDPA